jgi:hypothetical protein
MKKYRVSTEAARAARRRAKEREAEWKAWCGQRFPVAEATALLAKWNIFVTERALMTLIAVGSGPRLSGRGLFIRRDHLNEWANQFSPPRGLDICHCSHPHKHPEQAAWLAQDDGTAEASEAIKLLRDLGCEVVVHVRRVFECCFESFVMATIDSTAVDGVYIAPTGSLRKGEALMHVLLDRDIPFITYRGRDRDGSGWGKDDVGLHFQQTGEIMEAVRSMPPDLLRKMLVTDGEGGAVSEAADADC